MLLNINIITHLNPLKFFFQVGMSVSSKISKSAKSSSLSDIGSGILFSAALVVADLTGLVGVSFHEKKIIIK